MTRGAKKDGKRLKEITYLYLDRTYLIIDISGQNLRLRHRLLEGGRRNAMRGGAGTSCECDRKDKLGAGAFDAGAGHS